MKLLIKDFSKVFLWVVLAGVVLNILIFQLELVEDDYFICVENIENNLTLFDKNLEFNYPSSCDQDAYYEGFENFNNIVKRNHEYQQRPLYILSVNVFFGLLNFLLNFSQINSLHLAVFLNHSLILSCCLILLSRTIKFKINFSKFFPLIIISILNPIFKWGMFTPSNQTLTFLEIVYCFYVLKIEKPIDLKKQSFLIGLLTLAHRPFLICFLILIFKYVVVDKNYKKSAILTLIFSCLLYSVPALLFRSYIILLGYQPFNEQTDVWGQFVWIFDYLRGLEKYGGGWHCVKIPENFICYFEDTLKVTLYLSSFLVGTLLLTFMNWNKLKKDGYYLLSIFVTFYAFYSLIGWYPPLRFNLYSISNILIILISIFILDMKSDNIKVILFMGISLYLFGLNHWNAPGILINNLFTILGSVLIIISLVSYKNVLTKKSIPDGVK